MRKAIGRSIGAGLPLLGVAARADRPTPSTAPPPGRSGGERALTPRPDCAEALESLGEAKP